MLPRWTPILLILATIAAAKVGLNCSELDECEDESPCPTDSMLDPETNLCTCFPNHCSQIRCPVNSKIVISHNATRTPGDCCDIFECISLPEVNCSEVICPKDDEDCPPDSSRLPRSMREGDCCSVSHGCECFQCSSPPSTCPSGQTLKVVRPGNGKPGSCCPIYECQPLKERNQNDVCIYNGEEKPEGSKWKKNQCSECACIGGIVHCTASNCPPLPNECSQTTLPKGQCCPICVHPNDPVDAPNKPVGCMTSRGIIYENGATWEEDDCTFCSCKEGFKTCQAGMCQQKENSCKLPCEPSFAKDGTGNVICKCYDSPKCPSLSNCSKKCKHGYKTDINGCSVCKCDHCKPVDNCKKRCPNGFQTNERGCPACKCKPSPVTNGSVNARLSTDCQTDGGIVRDEGEAWFDGCRQCYCYGGKEMCSLVSCPKVTCSDATVSKNSCCPICPGNETRLGTHIVCYGPGGVKQEGDSWTDRCMECLCHSGRVLCHRELCPPTLCSHPLPPQDGSCCPTCPGKIEFPKNNELECGPERPAGSSWRQDSCVSCVCINGIADCYSQVCNHLDASCENPLQVKNQCCSICYDNFQEKNTCQMGNVTFSVGDVWEVKACERCTCGPGRVITCTQTVCESGCSNTDPCCPRCPASFGPDGGGGLRGVKLWMLLIFLSTFLAFVLAFVARHCCQKRHRFKICDPVPRNCNYKFVATYENPPTQPKGPV